DVAGAFAERVIAERLQIERPRRGAGAHAAEHATRRHEKKGRSPIAPASGKTLAYASLIRFARGPFWLGSISKLTRSPPASESKLTLESSPVRWKKYSLPSSAAMNPNPRSETSFLIVPVGID